MNHSESFSRSQYNGHVVFDLVSTYTSASHQLIFFSPKSPLQEKAVPTPPKKSTLKEQFTNFQAKLDQLRKPAAPNSRNELLEQCINLPSCKASPNSKKQLTIVIPATANLPLASLQFARHISVTDTLRGIPRFRKHLISVIDQTTRNDYTHPSVSAATSPP